MEIPHKVSIPVCIEQGSVYLYCIDIDNKDGTRYSGNRFLIVLNPSPKADKVLVLTTITKQIENQRRFIKSIGEDPDTLVPITPSDFPPLKIDSVVNCNNHYETTLAELIAKVGNGGRVFHQHKLPKTVTNALISGIMKSNQIPPEVKEMLI